MRLHDRVAIVTGGGGGMGGGIAMCLVREGARIVVSDVNLEGARACVREIEGAGGRALAVQSDVTSEADCKSLVDESIGEFGQIDIVVNNAGHFGERVGVANQTAAEWDDNWGVNVKGPFYLTRAVTTHMAERKFGKIVNISSVAAKRDPTFAPAYAASKNALLTLTRVFAKELAPHNINVNAICPGFVWTTFWERLAPMLAETDASLEGMGARTIFVKFVTGNIPLGREQSPEDVGNLVAFLCSEEARQITGQTINVDGGVAMG